MKERKFIVVIVALLLLFAGSSCSIGFRSGPSVERKAPDFNLRNLAGETVSLKDFYGRPVLLNFWASWCGPCRAEMPFFQEIYEDEEWQKAGLVILAINLQESRDTVAAFLESNGFTFTVLLDSDGEVGLRYNVRGIPATFFIDGEGVIRDMQIGAFTGTAGIEGRLANTIARVDKGGQ